MVGLAGGGFDLAGTVGLVSSEGAATATASVRYRLPVFDYSRAGQREMSVDGGWHYGQLIGNGVRTECVRLLRYQEWLGGTFVVNGLLFDRRTWW